MAKRSSLGGKFFLNGIDLSGDVGAVDSMGSPRELYDVTSVCKSATERIAGKADINISYTGFFNDATSQLHLTNRALGAAAAAQDILYAVAGAIGDPAFMAACVRQVDYAPTRGADGSLTIAITAQGAGGFAPEWGIMLTAGLASQCCDAALASINNATSGEGCSPTSTCLGIAAHLHVASITGGSSSFTAIVQQSSDNGSSDAFGTKLSMTTVAQASAPTSERKSASGATEQYLRVLTTGCWTNAKFAIGVRRGAACDALAY
jgi:hypothetical protein